MGAEALDAEVKARIPKSQKDQLEILAASRDLKVADLIREALREKFTSLRQPEFSLTAAGRDNGR